MTTRLIATFRTVYIAIVPPRNRRRPWKEQPGEQPEGLSTSWMPAACWAVGLWGWRSPDSARTCAFSTRSGGGGGNRAGRGLAHTATMPVSRDCWRSGVRLAGVASPVGASALYSSLMAQSDPSWAVYTNYTDQETEGNSLVFKCNSRQPLHSSCHNNRRWQSSLCC